MERTEFSGAYLLDPGHGVQSEFHQMLAEEIAYRYPKVRLAQVPMHERSEREEFPFALVASEDSEQPGAVLKELRESECNINFVFRWLYEHDTQRHGAQKVYEQYIAEKNRREKERQYGISQRLGEKLDFVNSMQRSPLHMYRHNGRKIGA